MVHDASTVEGNSGTHGLKFKVTLSKKAGAAVTVHYATSDVSARAGSDYIATSGTLTIAAGKTVGYVTVQIKGDKTKENNELFHLNLSDPSSNARIADGQASGVIRNDD